MVVVEDAVVANVGDVVVVAVGVGVVDHGSERDWWCWSYCCTDDCKGFVVTFAALIVDVVLVDEAAVVVPHSELVVVIGFDVVAAYVVDVLDSRVVVASHLAVYLVVVTVLNPLGGIDVYVDFVILILPVLQEVLTELVHLTNQLWLALIQ